MLSSQYPEHDKQHHSFQKELVKLRRVTRRRSPGWEDHGPRHVGHPAVQLSVYEIAQPSETEPDWSGNNNEVRGMPEIEPHFFAEQVPRNNAPDKSAMKRHSSVPDSKQFQGMTEIKGKVVKHYITQSGACQKTEYDI